MNVEFRGPASEDRYGDAVRIEGAVNGRPIRLRFTRDAVRSVPPTAADGRDLLARVTSHEEQFASAVARKLTTVGGESPAELTVTEADMLSAAGGVSGEIRWSDDGGWSESAVNEYA